MARKRITNLITGGGGVGREVVLPLPPRLIIRVRKFRRRGGANLGKRIATVEKQLRAGRETKIARLSGEKVLSAGINSSDKLINIMPDILNNGDITGNDSAGRIGSEIRLKKLVIKSWLRYAPNDA